MIFFVLSGVNLCFQGFYCIYLCFNIITGFFIYEFLCCAQSHHTFFIFIFSVQNVLHFFHPFHTLSKQIGAVEAALLILVCYFWMSVGVHSSRILVHHDFCCKYPQSVLSRLPATFIHFPTSISHEGHLFLVINFHR